MRNVKRFLAIGLVVVLFLAFGVSRPDRVVGSDSCTSDQCETLISKVDELKDQMSERSIHIKELLLDVNIIKDETTSKLDKLRIKNQQQSGALNELQQTVTELRTAMARIEKKINKVMKTLGIKIKVDNQGG